MDHTSPPRCSVFSFDTAHAAPGSADAVLAGLRESDAAAAQLFDMSMTYYRGDFQTAADMARALLETDLSFESYLSVCHMLSLEALYLGDEQKWLLSRSLLSGAAYSSERQRAQIAFSLAVLDSGIYVMTSFPTWLREGNFDPLPAEDFPLARFIYAKLLYIEGEHEKLAAVIGTLISQSKVEHALVSELYLRLVASMGFHSMGDEARAEKQLQAALELALPDRLYAPLAENRRNLGAGLERLMRRMDPEGLKTVLSLNDIILEGWTKLYNGLYGKKISNEMTPREYDVARLVIQGLTNKEIADRMGISTNTVKLYLRVVFDKLSISRREELTPYVWEKVDSYPK